MKDLVITAGKNRLLKKILLTMKLTIIITMFCLVSVTASTYSQNTRLDVSMKDGTMVDLIQQIEENSEFFFYYQKEELKELDQINLEARNATIMDILDKALAGTTFDYSVLDRYIVVRQKDDSFGKELLSSVINAAVSQQRAVSGTVTDAGGQPLPGVTVVVKGTTQGTVTNSDGNYTISNVPEDATLVFSFVGMRTQEVDATGRTAINMRMEEEAIGLEEVVAIGYGTRAKGRLTGAVSGIKEIDANTPTTNIQQSIQGKIPGMKINDRGGEPGNENTQLLIRGKSTLGNNTPLIIVDGTPQSSFTNIAPNDIAEISVLKDASAAIYGARAANGVILVNTKRGIAGTNNLTFNFNYGMASFTRIPEMMTAWQHAQYDNERNERYGRTIRYSDDDLQKFQSGSSPLTHPNTRWMEEVYDEWAPRSHYNISASGGTEKIQYFLSGDYQKQDFLYKASDDMNLKKSQIRSNINAHVNEFLEVGVNLSGRLQQLHNSTLGGASVFGTVRRLKPTEIAKFPNGLVGFGGEAGNPLIITTDKGGYNDIQDKVFNSKLFFALNMDWLSKGLKLKGDAAYNYEISNGKLFYNTWTEYKYHPENEEYEAVTTYNNEARGGFKNLQKSNEVDQHTYYNIRFEYDRTIGDHNVTGLLAYEQEEGNWESLSGWRRDLLSDQKVELFAGSTNQQETFGTANEWGRVNYFGSIGYDYQRKYLIDFTLRHDGSFNFANGKRFGTFPSVSAGWVINNEPYLKFRSSWGMMGNDAVDPFQYLIKYNLSSTRGYYIFGENPVRYDGFAQANVPNPNITWETAETLNFGLDALLFNKLLSVTIDYFYEKRRDILITRNASIPVYTGLQLPAENLGKVDNTGYEISINYENQIKNFIYSVGGNIFYNENKVVYIDEPENILDYRKNEGFPIDSWVVYKTDGIFNNQEEVDNTLAKLPNTKPGDIKYVDLNGDDAITGEDMYRRFSSPTPKIQYGIDGSFKYKNIGLNIFFQGQAKAEMYLMESSGDYTNGADFVFTKRWTENNKNADFPRAYERNDYYNNKVSDFWLWDASFVRLKNITLSYDLPPKVLSQIKLTNASVFIKGFNLWTIDKMSRDMGGKYYDPEAAGSTGITNYYPQQTIITTGISITL